MPTIYDESYSRNMIHPAVDILEDTFYFGIVMPYEEGGRIEEILHFITDKKECFPAFEDELANRKLKLRFPDVFPERRWRLEAIKSYLDNTGSASSTSSACSDEVVGIESALCFHTLKNVLEKHVYFYDTSYYTFISLWIIGTYLQPIWEAYPYLDITGFRRSGKTTLCKFLEATAFNSILSSSISASALFRTVQASKPTLIIDEAEKLTNPERAGEIRDLLLTGYKRAGGYAIRSEKTSKERIVPRRFNTFSPKAIVSGGGLEEYLADRSIPIVMIRTSDPEITKRRIREKDLQWVEIRDLCYRFALENWKDIKEIYDTIELPNITAREYEIWSSILSLAKFFGVFDEMYQFALQTIKEKETEDLLENRDIILLESLLNIATNDDYYSVSDIKKEMAGHFGGEEPKWLTNEWVGRALTKRLKFRDKRRIGKTATEYKLTPKRVREVAVQYGIQVTPIQTKIGTSEHTHPIHHALLGQTSETPASELLLPQIFRWIKENMDEENTVVSIELTGFIKSLNPPEEPNIIVAKMMEKGWLQPHPIKFNRLVASLP